MLRLPIFLCFSVLTLLVGITGVARADVKPLKLTKEVKGSVADETKQSAAPDCVVSEKGLKKLWDEWKIAGKPPEVNFDKEIVLVTISGGSQLSLSANLDAKGNVVVLGVGTFDIAPGFRYVLADRKSVV